jgi:hypothetical protein
MSETESQRQRRRWITLGELIALGALIVSGLGLWINWKSGGDDKPAVVVEQRQPIPLTLKAKPEDDGTRLAISPVESSHALESLTVKIGPASIRVGSDGELEASDVASALAGRKNEPKNQTLSVPARLDSRYVEAGKDKTSSGNYTLRYQWKGAGLFGGRSLHLVGLSRG